MPIVRYCPNQLCQEDSKYFVRPISLTRIYIRSISDKKIEYQTQYQYLKTKDFSSYKLEVSDNIKVCKNRVTDTRIRNIKVGKSTRNRHSLITIGWFCFYCKQIYLDEDFKKKYPTIKEIRNF